MPCPASFLGQADQRLSVSELEFHKPNNMIALLGLIDGISVNQIDVKEKYHTAESKRQLNPIGVGGVLRMIHLNPVAGLDDKTETHPNGTIFSLHP